MPEPRLRAAIIGCGRIGAGQLGVRRRHRQSPSKPAVDSHAAVLCRSPRVQVIALADNDPLRLRAARSRWRVQRGYADYRRLLAEVPLDLLSICTPNPTHAEVLLAAIHAGVKTIWMEKPLASSSREARRILAAAERAQTRILLNYSRRFSRTYADLRQRLQRGLIGPIVAVEGHYMRGLANNGSHLLDLCRFLFGEIAAVRGVDSLHETEPDASLDAFLLTCSGIPIYLRALPRHYDFFELRIFGERGQVDLVQRGAEPHLYRRIPSRECVTGYDLRPRPWRGPRGLADAWPRALANLLAVHRRSAPPLCSAWDGWQALRLVEMIRRSAQNRSRSLPLTSAEAACRH